jgi:CRISPR-associated protein Csx16
MTTWFVTRHPGAIEWASRQGIRVDRQIAHQDPADIQPGDTVIGTLPVNLGACRT